MTKQSAHLKAHIDRNTGKIIKKKHQQKVKVGTAPSGWENNHFYHYQDEKCFKCGFLVKNMLMLKMHLMFEHENDGETHEDR